jgi:hypothetical protein
MAEIGKVKCPACDFDRARVNEGKNMTLSITCSECGCLSMVKSPKAVAALRARLGVAAPAKAPNQDSFSKFLGGQ